MEKKRGSWKQICGTGDWVQTVLATISEGQIISFDQLGDIYKTDTETGKSKLVNNYKYTHSSLLQGAVDKFFNIDRDGTLNITKTSDGEFKQLSEFATYNQTVIGVDCGENLITIGKSGSAYITYPSGEWNKINDQNYSGTVFIMGGTKCFYTIENNNIYATNPYDGKCWQVGETGAFANTKLAVGMNDKIYTLETTGILWETDGETGKYSKVSDESFLNTRFLFAGNNRLYTIEPTGCLYEIYL